MIPHDYMSTRPNGPCVHCGQGPHEPMRPMSNKTPEIKDDLEKIFPGTTEAINQGNCPTCRKPVGEFRDELSVREYRISGMCQECQDGVFGASPEGDD